MALGCLTNDDLNPILRVSKGIKTVVDFLGFSYVFSTFVKTMVDKKTLADEENLLILQAPFFRTGLMFR